MVEIRCQALSEITAQPSPCNCCCGTGDCTSLISKRTVASAPSEPYDPRLRVPAASFELRAGSQALVGAAEDGHGGKR